ncbi:amino acid transporter AVT1C-like [Vicia villosa]|uniref:amino acid transporter AVT1C-like n=1 Tax=Vicia villosa TaxID=3911 RepID=UPI00273CBC99|nr:amino acid transporter AVT1C-like [Vicia villosa]
MGRFSSGEGWTGSLGTSNALSHGVVPAAGHGVQNGYSGQPSISPSVIKCISVLYGVGMLSTPYAAKEGGWVGLSILFTFKFLSFYTVLLLRSYLDSESGLETYPDICEAAFGTAGRIAILIGCCIEYIILEGENLASLFPNAYLNLGVFVLNPKTLFAVITPLVVLPTVRLCDLSILSYISAGGVIALVLVIMYLLWVGVEEVGHGLKFPAVLVAQLIKDPSDFVAYSMLEVLLWDTECLEKILSKFTLNLPQDLDATKIVVWTTVVNPFTKYLYVLCEYTYA